MNIFPENISTYGASIDNLGTLITVLVGIGFVGAMGLLIYSVVAFRDTPGSKAAHVHGDNWQQLKWVLIPVGLVLIADLFIDYSTHDAWYTIKQFLPTTDTMTVRITGQQFSWQFTYPDANGKLDGADSFKTMNEFHVPANKNIVFELESKDVIHSFWVPALRLKQDAVPGRTIKGWFNAIKTGSFDIGCTQICGVGHTLMQANLVVEPPDVFQKWYAAKGKPDGGGSAVGGASGSGGGDPVVRGAQIAKEKTCLVCHTLDGKRLVGPSWKGLYGKTEMVVTNGKEREVKVDEEYLKKAIKEPMADIVKDYPPSMPALPLSDQEISDLIEYIKTVK